MPKHTSIRGTSRSQKYPHSDSHTLTAHYNVSDSDYRELNNLCIPNAFIKWARLSEKSLSDCVKGKPNFEKLVARARDELNYFKPKDLVGIANALARLPIDLRYIWRDLFFQIIRKFHSGLVANPIIDSYDPKTLSLLANAVARVCSNNDSDGIALVQVIAKHVIQRSKKSSGYLYDFIPQNIANLVNAVARVCPNNSDGIALVQVIAKHVIQRSKKSSGYLCDFIPQNIANLVNAVARVCSNNDSDGIALVQVIAKHLVEKDHLSGFNHQGLANLANAVARVCSTDPDGIALVQVIAKHVIQRSKKRSEYLCDFIPQNIANLANAVARVCPTDSDGIALMQVMVKDVVKGKRLWKFDYQGLADLAKAVGRICPNDSDGIALVCAIAKHVLQQNYLYQFSKDYLALTNLANGVARVCPDDPDGIALLCAIVKHVSSLNLIRQFKDDYLASTNLAKAVARVCPNDPDGINLVYVMAEDAINRQLLVKFDSHALFKLVNALVRVFCTNTNNDPMNKNVKLVEALVKHIVDKDRLLEFNYPNGLTNLASAVARVCPNYEYGITLVHNLTKHVLKKNLNDFDTQSLAILLNVIAKVCPKHPDSITLLNGILTNILERNLDDFKAESIASLLYASCKFDLFLSSKDVSFNKRFKLLSFRLLQRLNILRFETLGGHDARRILQSILYLNISLTEEKLNALNKKIKETTLLCTSALQKKVFNALERDRSSFDLLQQEFYVGGNYIDIAVICKGKNIAIQVDGPHHLLEATLQADDFQTHLLEKQDWIVLRLSHSELPSEEIALEKYVKERINNLIKSFEVSKYPESLEAVEMSLKKYVEERIDNVIKSFEASLKYPESLVAATDLRGASYLHKSDTPPQIAFIPAYIKTGGTPAVKRMAEEKSEEQQLLKNKKRKVEKCIPPGVAYIIGLDDSDSDGPAPEIMGSKKYLPDSNKKSSSMLRNT